MTSDFIWKFITRDGSWNTQLAVLDDDIGNCNRPQIAMNENGTATVVWEQKKQTTIGTKSHIWSNRYTPGTNWSSPAPVAEFVSVDSVDPRVGMDKNGNAIVVWKRFNDPATTADIHACIYNTDTKTWSSTRKIEAYVANESSDKPQISVSNAGNAVAVWKRRITSGINTIFADQYINGTWGTPKRIEPEDRNAYDPHVVMDNNGNAIGVWRLYDTTNYYNVYSSIYNSALTPPAWEDTIRIGLSGSDVSDPRVAGDGKGNAIAIWIHYSAPNSVVYALPYQANKGGWGSVPIKIGVDTGQAIEPQVAMNKNGSGIAVWREINGARGSIFANVYLPDKGWGTPTRIELGASPDDSYDPQVAIDNNGNGVVVWTLYDGVHNSTYANRYISGKGWGDAKRIEPNVTSNSSIYPQVAIDGKGRAIAVWQLYNGTKTSIYSIRFE
jgi:hypothetical protein